MRSYMLSVLSKAAKRSVQPGEIVDAWFDYAMLHDGSAMLTQTHIEEKKADRLFLADRTFVIFDHIWPPNGEETACLHQRTRDFCRQFGLKFHEGGEGICHQLLLESDEIKAGLLIAGGDSHTTTIGAKGCLGIGFGAGDMADILIEGKTWLKVPQVIRMNLEGVLPEGVLAKDVALGIAGRYGTNFANYRAIEFASAHPFSLSDRAVLCNMAAEFGAKTAVWLPDDWDDGAGTDDVVVVDFSMAELEPLVAKPSSPANVVPVREVESCVDVAFLGTCTGGRIDDFRVADEAMQGRAVAAGVRMIACPASRTVYETIVREGIAERLIVAGATILPPGCGPCLGAHMGVLSAGERCISTANRNFPGRMGAKSAKVFLGSPATVARSAVEGRIASPHVSAKRRWTSRLEGVDHVFKPPADVKPLDQILKEIGFDSTKNRIWQFGDNIDTDQIIAGKYLRTANHHIWREHVLETINPIFAKDVKSGDVIVAGKNFGCGSSREQAAIALELCGLKAIIVRSVARIFVRNCVDLNLSVYDEIVTTVHDK